MRGVLHFIDADLWALEECRLWACWDVTDEHWLYLWEGVLG